MLQKEQGCWGEKKKKEERKRKEGRMKEWKRETVVLDEQSTWRGWNSTAASGIFDVSRCFQLEDPIDGMCIAYSFFFFSPPLPDETHLRYCLSALRNGGEGDTSKEEKDWDGKYGGNMNHDESSRERLLSSNSITSVKYILSNNRGRMVKSFNHTKWNGWETGEIYEIRVEILWKWEIQLFAMACN